MATRLYVGNLPFSTTNEELRELFSSYGTVTDVHVVTDRETGRPRGFAFVSLETPEMARAAVEGMNERRIGGRPLVVNQARERGEAPPRRPSTGGPPGGASRPPARPRPSAAPPPASAVPLAPGEEGAKEIRRRPKKRKGKAAEGRGERGAQSRHQLLEESEVSRGTGGNWRQWLDDDEADLADIKAPWEEIEVEEDETTAGQASEGDAKSSADVEDESDESQT